MRRRIESTWPDSSASSAGRSTLSRWSKSPPATVRTCSVSWAMGLSTVRCTMNPSPSPRPGAPRNSTHSATFSRPIWLGDLGPGAHGAGVGDHLHDDRRPGQERHRGHRAGEEEPAGHRQLADARSPAWPEAADGCSCAAPAHEHRGEVVAERAHVPDEPVEVDARRARVTRSTSPSTPSSSGCRPPRPRSGRRCRASSTTSRPAARRGPSTRRRGRCRAAARTGAPATTSITPSRTSTGGGWPTTRIRRASGRA